MFATTALAAPANVLFIMPDDLSYDDYSLYNADGPRTPNVDKLSRECVRLTDFHVSPTCSPSRAAFMTGRYTDDTGAWHTVLGREFMWADEVTMADVFKANGYSTAIYSKWHLGESYPFRPQDRGFEHTVIIRGGGIDQQPDHWDNRNNAPVTLYIDDEPVELTEANAALPGKKGVFATNFFTNQAIDYMTRQAATGKPFFVYMPYNVAHGPQDMPPDARPGVSAHTATVENMDTNIGRIIDFLDQSGLADNTILVVVLGDNGMRNHLYRGSKGSEYEAGHRVPCYIRWKAGGIGGSPNASTDVHDLIGNLDMLPTLMDLAGLHDVANRPRSVPIQGQSFKALLTSNDAQVRAAFAGRTMVMDNQRMDDLIKYKQASVMRNVMNADGATAHEWRLIIPSANKPAELYDVKVDPHEKTDLSRKPEHADLVASLKADYETWWKTASTHADDFARPILGSQVEPEICLYSHDWHTGGKIPPWNQGMIAAGLVCNGYHSVAFGAAGDYAFDLRRWPKEVAGETTVTSVLAKPIRVGNAGNDGQYKLSTGKALPIHSARLRIWNGDHAYFDDKQAVDPDSDGPVFTVKSLPAGPAMVQTWFYDADGKELCGAYYVYTQQLKPAAK
ncbi:MAG: sulfatase-like hydrolase/transferase [Phycisphaera sp.]|nr:sulfatase-like hydrolase/transferase [Phycisphaera sp.]